MCSKAENINTWKVQRSSEFEDSVSLEDKLKSNSSKDKKGLVSVSLLENMVKPQNPSLFDSKNHKGGTITQNGFDENIKALWHLDSERYIDRKYKPVFLTDEQKQICLALSFYLTTHYSYEEDFTKYVKYLDNGGINIESPYLSISLTELTRIVKSGSARTREKESILNDLFKLRDIKHIITYERFDNDKNCKNTHIQVAPLINFIIDTVVKDKGNLKLDDPKEQIINGDKIYIRFCNLFFIGLAEENKKFAILKPSLFKALNSIKNKRNPVYTTLLIDLLSKCYQYRSAIYKVEEFYKGKKVTDDGIKEKQQNIDKARHYPLTQKTLIEKLDNYYKENYNNLRLAEYRLKTDYLPRAIKSFIEEIGIITDETYIDDDLTIHFYYNLKYLFPKNIK